ncbi:MAG: DUF4097 family beta strand repeat protein [Bryobacterales bacterium]|nr:DUF4097 family beta strand repeat protein [Bryobacterales bacterium]
MNPRSLVGPLLLIGIGVLFLMRNVWPDIPLFELLSRYWPLLLILWGTVRLGEVLFWYFSGRALPASGVSGGEWSFVVLLCVVGSMVFWGSNYYQKRWPAGRITVKGLEIFGEPYEFPVAGERAAVGKNPKVILDLGRGNARIVGSDTESIKITGRKTIRAFDQADAGKGDKATPLEIVPVGDQIMIRTNQERIDSSSRASVELEITVPKGTTLEGRGRYGDFDVSDLTGMVEINSDNAGVRVQNVGALKVEVGRSDIVRAVKVAGPVDIKTRSRGQDVEIESAGGPVTVNGSYSGQLSFRDLPKPLRFESPETEFRVEKVMGNVRIDLSNITVENVMGPVRLNTKSRDVQFSDFSQSLDISLQRGDIEIRPGRGQFGKIEARTKNGNIDFVAPLVAKFEIAAKTERGEIENDYGPPLKVAEEGRGNELRGATGAGPTVNLTTDRGSINVRKAAAEPERAPQVLPKTVSPPLPAEAPPVPQVVRQ